MKTTITLVLIFCSSFAFSQINKTVISGSKLNKMFAVAIQYNNQAFTTIPDSALNILIYRDTIGGMRDSIIAVFLRGRYYWPALMDSSLVSPQKFATFNPSNGEMWMSNIADIIFNYNTNITGKPTLGTASGKDTLYFATAAQGLLASTALQSEFDPLFNTKLSTKTTTDLTEGLNLYYTAARFNSGFLSKTTSDLSEGSNLYWTTSRFDTRFSTKTTSDLTEGTNLYYTASRFNTSFGVKTTTDLAEGTNLYYTTTRFNTAFSGKLTTDLIEGSNLYYTEARVSANTTVASNTAARHNAITIGTANGLSLATQVLSLGLSSISTNGSLSSTDWNTFNGKLSAEVDGSIANEVQTISINNGTISLSLSGGSINIPDSSATNEIELPSQTGNSGKFLTTNGTSPLWSTISYITAVDTLSSARVFNTGYTMSATKYVEVKGSVSISCSLSLSGGQGGNVFIETSPDNATWTTMGQVASSNTGALTIGLSTIQVGGGQVSCMVPPTYYWRLRTVNVTGTPTFTMLQGSKTTY